MAVGPYTEITFADFLIVILGEVAPLLDWHGLAQDPVQEALNDTLLALATEDITTITDLAGVAKLRAFGRVAIWRAAVDSLAARYDVADNGQDLKRSQIQKMAQDSYTRALEAVSSYLQEAQDEANAAAMTVIVTPVIHTQDPYGPIPWHERMLP